MARTKRPRRRQPGKRITNGGDALETATETAIALLAQAILAERMDAAGDEAISVTTEERVRRAIASVRSVDELHQKREQDPVHFEDERETLQAVIADNAAAIVRSLDRAHGQALRQERYRALRAIFTGPRDAMEAAAAANEQEARNRELERLRAEVETAPPAELQKVLQRAQAKLRDFEELTGPQPRNETAVQAAIARQMNESERNVWRMARAKK